MDEQHSIIPPDDPSQLKLRYATIPKPTRPHYLLIPILSRKFHSNKITLSPVEFGWLTMLESPGGVRFPILQITSTDRLMIACKCMKLTVVVTAHLKFELKLSLFFNVQLRDAYPYS